MAWRLRGLEARYGPLPSSLARYYAAALADLSPAALARGCVGAEDAAPDRWPPVAMIRRYATARPDPARLAAGRAFVTTMLRQLCAAWAAKPGSRTAA